MRRRKQRIGERAREYRGPRSKEGQGVRFEREGDCFAGGEERGVEWFAGLAFSWRFHSFPLLGRGGFGKIKNRTILKKIKKKVGSIINVGVARPKGRATPNIFQY